MFSNRSGISAVQLSLALGLGAGGVVHAGAGVGQDPLLVPARVSGQDTLHYFLGEERPGDLPMLFGPGIVSTDAGMYGTVVFSPDHTEAVWATDEHPGLFHSRYLKGEWTGPSELEILPGFRLSSPFFSFDGDRLYFMAAGRDAAGFDTGERIMVSRRSGEDWTEPRDINPRINSSQMHWQFSLDRTGTLYFSGEGADLYRAEFRNGEYLDPVRLPAPLNTDAPETSPHVSPDGSILLFDRWFETSPYVRIMASFLGPHGSWSEPVDLSTSMKSEGNDSAARLTPDGRYLFFQSVREGSDPNRSVYWLDAAFLETLRAGRPGLLTPRGGLLRDRSGRLSVPEHRLPGGPRCRG